jgi:uncharacterized protein involved in exopolysaccharide biosynthesis
MTHVPAGWNDPTELRAFRLAARRPGWIICTTLLCVGAAVLYVAIATPVYTGIARLRVQQDDPLALGPPALERGIEQTTSFLNAELAVIVSGPVLELAVKNMEEGTPSSIDAIGNLRARLRTQLGRKDGIITVQADAASPTQATVAVGAVVNAYVAWQSRLRDDTNQRLLDVVLNERTERAAVVREKTAQLVQILKSAGTASFSDTRVTDESVNLHTSLRTARQETLAAETCYREALAPIASDPALMAELNQHKGADGSPRGLEVESSQLRSALAGLEIEKAKLTGLRGLLPQHPQVREIQTQLNSLRVLYAASTYSRWTQATLREQQLRELVHERELRTVQLADQASQYAGLEIDLKRQERQLDALEGRIVELQARQGWAGRNITVIDPAAASARPTKPDKWPILALSLLGGLGLGMTGAYLRQISQSRSRIQPQSLWAERLEQP